MTRTGGISEPPRAPPPADRPRAAVVDRRAPFKGPVPVRPAGTRRRRRAPAPAAAGRGGRVRAVRRLRAERYAGAVPVVENLDIPDSTPTRGVTMGVTRVSDAHDYVERLCTHIASLYVHADERRGRGRINVRTFC